MGSSPIPQQGTTIPTPGQPMPLGVNEWQPSGSATVVNFRHHGLDPSNYAYVQTGDQLVCTVSAMPGTADNVTFSVRLLLHAPPTPGQPSDAASAQMAPATPNA